jgi:hypothetical protein
VDSGRSISVISHSIRLELSSLRLANIAETGVVSQSMGVQKEGSSSYLPSAKLVSTDLQMTDLFDLLFGKMRLFTRSLLDL